MRTHWLGNYTSLLILKAVFSILTFLGDQTENKRMNIYIYIMTKEPRIFSGGEDSFFNKCWENWTAYCKRLKLDGYPSPHAKI